MLLLEGILEGPRARPDPYTSAGGSGAGEEGVQVREKEPSRGWMYRLTVRSLLFCQKIDGWGILVHFCTEERDF